MNTSDSNARLRLKQGGERGWFAAGEGFRRALGSLSDGAFKLFAWLCLEAERESGRIQATHKELSRALGKSKRAVGGYVAELEAKGMCRVEGGTNQHAPRRFEICEDYWPYQRVAQSMRGQALADDAERDASAKCGEGATQVRPKGSAEELEEYVGTIREWFIRIGCGKGSFNAADGRYAGQLQQRGVRLGTVESALLVGEARKYESWLNGGGGSPISSLRYFEPLIAEVEQSAEAFSGEYKKYLRGKITKSAGDWNSVDRRAASMSQTPIGGQGEIAGAKR